MFTMKADTFFAMLSAAMLHVSKDTTRPHFNSISFDVIGRLIRMVATDGHRLIKIEREIATTDGNCSALVALADCTKLAKSIGKKARGEIRIGFDTAKSVVFEYNNSLYTFAKVDTAFGPYAQVIPNESATGSIGYCGVNARYLADAQKALVLMGGPERIRVRFSGGELDPYVIDTDAGNGNGVTIVVMPMRVVPPSAAKNAATKRAA